MDDPPRLKPDDLEGEVGIQYNFEVREWARRYITFRRRAHQWIFEIEFKVDSGNFDKAVMLSITPLVFTHGEHEGSIFDPMLGEYP